MLSDCIRATRCSVHPTRLAARTCRRGVSSRSPAMGEHPSSDQGTKGTGSGKFATAEELLREDERIRQLLLDRDGGSASVPTREGKWDQDMGRETSRQMHRVLDQVRVNKPGTSTSLGDGESKWFTGRG